MPKILYTKKQYCWGNIAHNIHPIAGQGLNLSIKDIAVFVNQIKKYKSLGYRLNDQMVLEEFEMKRKMDNTAYSFGTFLLDDIFSYLDIRFIRNIIDRLNELKLQTWMTDVRLDSIHQIEKFKSKIHNINIDDNRFKVLNN